MPHLGIDLFARAQYSFGKPMARAEQIGLVGANGLSGFDAGRFMGDSGIVGRAEFSSPWNTDLAGNGLATASPYLFGSYGTVWLMQPTSLEQARTSAGAYGLGVRFGGAPRAAGDSPAGPLGAIDQATLTLEWARQYGSQAEDGGDRITFSGAIKF
jgi:hemolysin activation/secretion protein